MTFDEARRNIMNIIEHACSTQKKGKTRERTQQYEQSALDGQRAQADLIFEWNNGTMAATTTAHSHSTSSSIITVTRLIRDSKSRYKIGEVYLKTGDYTKAEENLSHSLYCYIQIHGKDSSDYSDEAAIQIAEVRERLGDCYAANPDVQDKCLAMDHYAEVRRLLQNSSDGGDVAGEAKAMLERVEEKINDPELLMSDSGVGSARSVPMPEVPASYAKAQKRNKEGGAGRGKEGHRGNTRGAATRTARDVKAKKVPQKSDIAQSEARHGKKNIQNTGRGFIEGMIEDVDGLLKKRDLAKSSPKKPRQKNGDLTTEPRVIRSDTSDTEATGSMTDSLSSVDAFLMDKTHKDAATARKLKQFARKARLNVQKISRARSIDQPKDVDPQPEQQVEDEFQAKSTKYSSEMGSEESSVLMGVSSTPHSSSTSNKEENIMQTKNENDSGSKVSTEEEQKPLKYRSGMGSQIFSRAALLDVDALTDEESVTSTKSKKTRSSMDIINEYQETVGKMRAQLSAERRGFAIMTSKFVEEKNKMSTQIEDLSWKVALRGKRISRLEKEVNKLKESPMVDQVVEIEHVHWEVMDISEFFIHVESKFFKLEKELEGCKWVIKSITKSKLNRSSLPSRLDLLLGDLEEMTSITETLIEGLESWLSSHDHAAAENEDLFFHVETKFFKLKNGLQLCKGIVESLTHADFHASSSILSTRLQMLSDGLNEVASTKNELFATSTDDPYSSILEPAAAQTNGQKTVESSDSADIISDTPATKRTSFAKQPSIKPNISSSSSRGKLRIGNESLTPGSESTATTASTADSLLLIDSNYKALANHISTQRRRNSLITIERPRQRAHKSAKN